MSSKNVTKVVWYIPVQLSSLTTQGLWFQVSVFRCQLNSSKLKAEDSKVDGQGSYKARKLESSMALKLQTSWLSNLSALSLQL
jgi:hypothetical protein